jgi:hypothetical protein
LTSNSSDDPSEFTSAPSSLLICGMSRSFLVSWDWTLQVLLEEEQQFPPPTVSTQLTPSSSTLFGLVPVYLGRSRKPQILPSKLWTSILTVNSIRKDAQIVCRIIISFNCVCFPKVGFFIYLFAVTLIDSLCNRVLAKDGPSPT